MARGMPNLTALLGLLALAGYKNRDKISEMLSKAQDSLSQSPQQPTDPAAAGELSDMFGADKAGGTVAGGLGELFDRFKQAGQQKTADSWISNGPNEPVQSQSLEQAIGADTLNDLSASTGLSPQEILARLSNDLPNAVNDMTPNGRLPNELELRDFR